MAKRHPFWDYPEVRRDVQTGTIVLHDGQDVEFPWLVIWSPTADGWARCADEAVGTWPFLNQCHHPDKWVQDKLESWQRAQRAWHKEYGRLSKLIGDLRAQLARQRERTREAEGAAHG